MTDELVVHTHYALSGEVVRVEVVQAPDAIVMHVALLAEAEHLRSDETGALVIAGQVRYRPTGFHQDGKVVALQRVKNEEP